MKATLNMATERANSECWRLARADLGQLYTMLNLALKRVEERMERLEQRMDKMVLRSELLELKARVDGLQ